MSNSTRSPSASDLKPLPWIAEWWTKQSFWPFSGVMKPKPLASLNHLTVPVIRIAILQKNVVIGVPGMPYAPNTVEIVVAFASRSAAARDHSLSSNEQSTLKHKGATAEAKPLWSTELCASCALLPH